MEQTAEFVYPIHGHGIIVSSHATVRMERYPGGNLIISVEIPGNCLQRSYCRDWDLHSAGIRTESDLKGKYIQLIERYGKRPGARRVR